MHSKLFQMTSKISALARSGCITQARKLFDEMPNRDTVAWNAMLSSYSQLGLHLESLSLYYQMRTSNTKPDHFTFSATLSACAGATSLLNGTRIHALVIVFGYRSSLPVNNALIDMYGKCLNTFSAGEVFKEIDDTNEVAWCSLLFAYANSGQFDEATKVFNLMPRKVDIAWNTMISGLSRYGQIEMCLDLFREMRQSLCKPDQFTYSALMNACIESSELLCGCMLHGVIIKSGWGSAVEANNSILSFYAKIDSLNDAIKVFESTEMPTQVSWNAMIDAYMKVGNIQKAFLMFQHLPEKNVVSWTSMVAGYARNGHEEEALSSFVSMIRNSLLPDDFTIGAILHACSSLAVLAHGRMVHGYEIRRGFNSYLYVGNGLINMYAKCGDLDGSIQAFDDICVKDLVSFNAMLFAFGLHGKACRTLQLYDDMVASGIKPDKMTFIGLLTTCSHSGQIEEGRAIFNSISSVHGLPYEADHVACMVDMLGRGGYLAEAKELASKYAKTGNDKAIWCEALLGACSAHGELEMGTDYGEALKVLEPHKDMSYVLQSNLYSVNGQWKQAATIRKAMVNEGLKKMPGCSWIEVRNGVTSFVAGDRSHPYMEELCKILYFLEFEMRNPSLTCSGT